MGMTSMLHHNPIIRVIPQPACERCGAIMFLTRIEPDKPDHDKRVYECTECKNEKLEVVKYR